MPLAHQALLGVRGKKNPSVVPGSLSYRGVGNHSGEGETSQ